jgi:hypothetical protein
LKPEAAFDSDAGWVQPRLVGGKLISVTGSLENARGSTSSASFFIH